MSGRRVSREQFLRAGVVIGAGSLYLFHCHILEHEDAGMMINCKVVDPHG